MPLRYVTVENYNGAVKVYTEQDDYKSAINHDDTACWIWQFADNPEQAVDQHYTKHDEWSADMDAGRPEKTTY